VVNSGALTKYEEEKAHWDTENERLKHELFTIVPDSISEILQVSPSSRSTNQQAELAKYWELHPEGKKVDAELAAHTKKQPKIPGPQAGNSRGKRETACHLRSRPRRFSAQR